MQEMAKCLRDMGYEARVVEADDGSYEVEYAAPGLSVDEEDDLFQKCENQIPAAPEPVTEADLRVLYDHMVEQTKCIQAKGHKTPPIPSWQSFLEMAKRSDITWIPNEYLEGSESNEVMKACTPDPDLWW